MEQFQPGHRVMWYKSRRNGDRYIVTAVFVRYISEKTALIYAEHFPEWERRVPVRVLGHMGQPS